jgi:hypothetical protein
MLIDNRVKVPELDSKGATLKPLILLEMNFFTIPHLPSKTHFCGRSSQHDPFPKGGAVSSIRAKYVWGRSVIPKIYN